MFKQPIKYKPFYMLFYLKYTYMVSNQKVSIVTGSSSGIGLETALILARNGYFTYATMRTPEKDAPIKTAVEKENLPIKVIQLDVTDDESLKNAINHVTSEAGRIDVLVNNAGYGLVGALEDLSMEEIKTQFETNLFGLVRVIQAVLPTMRRQRSGRILNLSSGAGLFGYPGGSAYVSTKFAVEGLSESIAYELEPFGIKVILIEPGFIQTNFSNSMVVAKKAQDPTSPYSQMMQRIVASSNELAKNGSSADLVANVILDAATNPSPRLRYLVGKDVEAWAASKKSMDESEFFNMIKKISA
jgi:NAD(P)-dependent dehydrogenase (short-subunit alcohol dehydrogenase family)